MILVADTSSCSPRICAARSALQRCHRAMAACWDLRVPDPCAVANDRVLAGGMRAEVTSPTSSCLMPPTGWPSAPFPLPVGWNGDDLKAKCWRWRSYAQTGDGMTVCRGTAPWLCVSTCFCYISNSVTCRCVFQYTFLGCICYSR